MTFLWRYVFSLFCFVLFRFSSFLLFSFINSSRPLIQSLFDTICMKPDSHTRLAKYYQVLSMLCLICFVLFCLFFVSLEMAFFPCL